MTDDPASRPTDAASRRPLLVTSDVDLLDDVVRLAAAAGVELDLAGDPAAAARWWADAPLVVVGIDLAARLARDGLPRRSDVLLVGPALDPAGAWDLAVEVGADAVLLLPDAQALLIERLGQVGDGPSTGGRTVAVIGGRGGAGASILAAALGLVAAEQGVPVMLVDADPLGGGIDMVLGREDAPGLRWPDLAGTAGRLSAGHLRAALPRAGGVTMLSCGRGESLQLSVDAVRSVLAAGRRCHDLVVVDLPRRLDAVTELVLSTATVVLLVVPAEVRATAAAGRVATGVGLLAADVRAVVRGPAPSGLTGPLVANSLGLPLAGWLDPEPDLQRALEHGRPPATDGRGPLATLCRELVADLLAERRRAA